MAFLNEPNDRLALAYNATGDFAGGSAIYQGVIGDNAAAGANDVDYVRIDLSAGDKLAIDTVLGGLADSILRVFDAQGNELEVNDDYYSLASHIDFVAPSAGTFYVGVSGYANFSYNPLVSGSGTRSFYTGDYSLSLSSLERAPVAAADGAITGEASAVLIAALGNDSDPDGDQLAVIAVNGQAVAPGSAMTLPSGALLTLADDGTFGYDPSGVFDGLHSGEAVQDNFNYTIEDGRGGTATATVAVTVEGADNPPVVNPDDATTTERSTVTVNVLANDAGALPGRGLTVTAINGVALSQDAFVELSSGAQVRLNADQTITYDPNGRFSALGVGESETEVLSYAVTDTAGNSGASSIAITVTGLNDNPVANDDAFATDEETIIQLKILLNDSDPDGNPVDLSRINGRTIPGNGVITLPSGAVLTVGDDGGISYDPRAAFDRLPGGVSVSDSFTYAVSDGKGGRDVGLATVSVAGFSDPEDLVPAKTFNALEYIASYRDLVSAFGANAAAGRAHYQTAGFGEDRIVSFDGLEYIASYQDLIRAFGANRDAGAAHYINAGLAEGRATTFNAFEYVASYVDLSQAFGVNQAAGAMHYLQAGIREGRSASFDGLEYIASYQDLRAAFGADEDAGAAHYIAVGREEGRTVRFDGLQYIASYSDLIRALGANSDAGSTHFIRTGAREGRIEDRFDADQYLSNYTDLRAAFGSDTEAATRHFITSGFAEGRTDDPIATASDFIL